MSFVIPTEELNFLINEALNVVPVKASVQILSNLLFEVRGGMLKITATDLMVGISCETDVKMLKEGAVALPAKKLASLLRELTAPTLQVTIHDNFVTEIQAGTSKFKIHGMAPIGFPQLPEVAAATSASAQ